MTSNHEPSIEELFEYLDTWYESKTPKELQAIQDRQAKIDLRPMPVTLCNTCDEISLGHRLGCAHSDCPGQPVSLNVELAYMNTQGRILREDQDFCWIPEYPSTSP